MVTALGTPKRHPKSSFYLFRKRVPEQLREFVGNPRSLPELKTAALSRKSGQNNRKGGKDATRARVIASSTQCPMRRRDREQRSNHEAAGASREKH
jgi:hypothetical protein